MSPQHNPILLQWWSGAGSLVSVRKGAVLSLKELTEGFSMAFLPDRVLLPRHNVTICGFTTVQTRFRCSHSAQSAEHFRSIYPGGQKGNDHRKIKYRSMVEVPHLNHGREIICSCTGLHYAAVRYKSKGSGPTLLLCERVQTVKPIYHSTTLWLHLLSPPPVII